MWKWSNPQKKGVYEKIRDSWMAPKQKATWSYQWKNKCKVTKVANEERERKSGERIKRVMGLSS